MIFDEELPIIAIMSVLTPTPNLILHQSLREACLNTELFLVRIKSEYRKIRTRNNSVFGHFSHSEKYWNPHDNRNL